MAKINPDQIQLVEQKVLQGVINRSQHIAVFFAFAFLVFGLYTYPIFSQHMIGLTPWNNTWPRLFLNTIPFLVMWKVLDSERITRERRVMIWTLGLPTILQVAAWINCWPLILKGNQDVFFAVHTQNTYALSLWFLYASPPFRQSMLMVASCVLLFLGPFAAVISSGFDANYVLNIYLNDTVAAMAINILVANVTSKLRYRLGVEDAKNKELTKRLLGGRLAEAIFENREDLLNGFERATLVVAIDLRGFTKLVMDQSEINVTKILQKYHEIISTVSGRYGAFLHKSSGDGHLLTFGLMENHTDLSDIPELEERLSSAEETRRRHLFSRADWMVSEIVDQFNKLRKEESQMSATKIGVGISFGMVSARMIGDNKYRQEFDIHGLAIIEAVRLEAFTKHILKEAPDADAVVASSQSFPKDILAEMNYIELPLLKEKIRDFESIDKLIHKVYQSNNLKRDAA